MRKKSITLDILENFEKKICNDRRQPQLREMIVVYLRLASGEKILEIANLHVAAIKVSHLDVAGNWIIHSMSLNKYLFRDIECN